MLRRSAEIVCVLLMVWVALRAQVSAQSGAPDQGTIAGKVIDKSTGDPIIEAGIEVTNTGKRVRTDIDGKYTLKLPAGTYELRVFAPLYQGTRLQRVVVRGNDVTHADAALAPEGQAGVEVVEVVAQADKASEVTQLVERKNAAVVSDNIGAQTITKSPDSNAGEVVKRVPAVTVQNDKFIVVRGLGERYSSALLNGSRLPSTDPNKRVVPLDLFPSEFIESLSVVKTYTPNLPGDFSGGLVDIRLKDFPEQLTANLGVSTGGNTNAVFQEFNTYHGSSLDYLGFGAGNRALPGAIPSQSIGTPPPAQQRAYASAFENVWSVEPMTAPPNYRLTGSVGNTFGPMGAALGAVYSTEYNRHPGEFQQNFTTKGLPGEPITILPLENFTFDRDTFTTRIGAVLSTGYKLTPTDKLTLKGLVDRSTKDEVDDGQGSDRNNPDQPLHQWQLQEIEEQLGYGQLAGTHRWSVVDVDWRSALSQTTQDQPDTRFVTYNLPTSLNGLTAPQLVAAGEGPESLVRLYGNLDEYLTDSALDFTVPFKTGLPYTDVWSGLPAKFKFGPAYAYRHRNFSLRRFLYNRVSTVGVDTSASPEVQLQPANIPENYSFKEGTRKQDSFEASQEIIGGYGMFDLPLVPDRLRLVAGVRVEYSYISLNTADFIGNPVSPKINDTSPLPGINLIYSPRDDMNFRYGYSQSVSRPEFRELTPTIFPVPNGARPVIGNPNLQTANITSNDWRWEWFFAPAEIVSFSVFYKQFTNPIEQTVIGLPGGEADSFRNADNADLVGFEFEGRKNLGFVSPYLANVNLSTNVAYISSSVNVGPQQGTEVQTSSSRSLQGQADYVVNSALEYDHPTWGTARLLYNTVGANIVAAGANRLPDITQQPTNVLDLVLITKINPFGTPLTAKLSAENMLDEQVVQSQGSFVASSYTTGVKFTFGLSYSY
ncbi:MAG: carboxypeptidase regulatory-like domain-containing protein [Deltaproteobacteria bacterium]|nr:carboxypeptidase regulatory-like domain-containing protein [Deltaproteobacteria bacterium]MBI3386728.1 carboxypeptidase regulatory-like domain-containing protein [Deltaproteobacteria bacterium]